MRWEPLIERKFKIQLLLVSIIVGVLVIAGSSLYIGNQKELAKERGLQSISAISSLKVEQLAQWNEERKSEVSFFSTSESVLRFALPVIAGEKDKEPMLRRTLQHILSNNRYKDIALLDKNGNVLFSVASELTEIGTENKLMLKQVLQTQQVSFRDFYRSLHTGKPMVSYMAPILDMGNTPVAGMIFLIDPEDFFYPHIKKWPIPVHTAESYLVRIVENAIEYLSPLTPNLMESLPRRVVGDSLDCISKAVLSNRLGFVEGKDNCGVNVIAFSQHIPGTNWFMVSKVSKSELFADYYKTFSLVILFTISLLLLLWGGMGWVYKRRQRRMYEELHRKSMDLHHSQEEFGATLYSIGEGVIATDEKGFVTRMNLATASLTGWTEVDAKGRPIEDVFQTLDADSRLPSENRVRLALEQGGEIPEDRNGKTVLVAKNGLQVYVSTSVAPIKGLEGKVYGVVLVFRDQSEEQVRRRLVEARLSMFEYATRHNLVQTVSFMNQRTAELFKSPLCQFLVVESNQEGQRVRAIEGNEDADFISHRIWSTCLQTLQPVLYDCQHDDQSQKKEATPSVIDQALIVPVLRDNLPVALLGLANRLDGYAPAVVEHVSYLADVIWEITNEKQKELILLESEERYRNLVNQMQVGLSLHELILENGVPVNYRFLEVNPEFEKMMGMTREQLIGNTVLDVFPSTELHLIEKYGQVVLGGNPDNFEIYSLTLDKDYSVIAYPVGSMKFATIIEDVTERKHMIDALRSNQQSYKDLIDNIKDTVWIVDEKGKLFDVNNEVTKQLGYTKEEILQLGVRGIDATLSEKDILRINDNIINGVPQIFEAVHRTKSGKLIPVEVNAGRVNYMGKQVAVCLARDISQRKRAEGFQHLLYEIASYTSSSRTFDELLSMVHNELGKIMDATNFYVAFYHAATNSLDELLFVNEEYSAHSWPVEGTLSGHVLKTGKSLLLSSDERADFLLKYGIEEVETPPSSWMGVPLSDGETAIGVLVIQHYSDPYAYDSSNLQILEMLAHELSSVIQRQRMISDLIHAKEKAEESDRLKTAFLANVSHEIRTPMNGIIGFIELLDDPDTKPEERATYMDIVSKSGRRLLATIDDIVEISRIEAGLIEEHLMLTDLAEIMEFHLSFFLNSAKEKGLTLELKECLKGKGALVEIDKFKLDGVLSNLLNNALKFTHNGGIVFGNILQDGELLFYVSDTGIGIPLDRQDAIFQRFVQADLTSTRPYEGSGLGLSIVKAYLEKLGGRIWLESAPGKGSTFYFTLPYKPVLLEEIYPVEHENVHDVDKSTPVTVLVAEDDPASFAYLKALFSKEGIAVLHASDGEEAVALIKEHPEVDIIFMDIKMPGMSGLEATRAIRQFNNQVPIIAQTAFAFARDKDDALHAGCTDYLTKPTSRNRLLAVLKQYVNRLNWDGTNQTTTF